MTNPDRDHLAWQAARVRRLTDPLGASGQRRTGERIQREQRGRRMLLGAAVGTFLALLAAIAGGSSQEPPIAPPDAGIVYAVDQEGNVQAVRIVQPEVAEARTRSS